MPFDHVGGGQLHQLLLALALTRRYQVELIHHVPDLDLERLRHDYRVQPDGVGLRYVDTFPSRWPYTKDASDRRPRFAAHRSLTRGYDLFVNVTMGPPLRCYAPRGVLLVLFPAEFRETLWPWNEPDGLTGPLKRAVRNSWLAARWRAVFRGYQLCIANSEFTARWVRKRWDLEAKVLHPLVPAGFGPITKERLILSVGRFSTRGTRKRQLEMVRSFAGSVERFPGWRFLCIGGLARDPADQAYFREVSEAARGFPIQVLANPSGTEVRRAYERAAIFWHAAGLGEDEEVYPERAEHFGMSTVEAMAARCVPVVIRKGGQPEIVQHGSNGFLWDAPEQLVQLTAQLAASPELLERISRAAAQRAQSFTDPDLFANRLLSLMSHE
jgi:glycosyltransferase involved in cell wall biosynthesis